MNQSLPGGAVGETAAQWEERLRQHPELLPQIVALLDIVELRRADTATADQAETGLRVALQQLGQQALGAWAHQRQQQVITQRHTAGAAVQQHAKKNFTGTAPSALSRSRSSGCAGGGAARSSAPSAGTPTFDPAATPGPCKPP